MNVAATKKPFHTLYRMLSVNQKLNLNVWIPLSYKLLQDVLGLKLT